MKFADSSKPGQMTSDMKDGIWIQNDLNAQERGREHRERESGRGKSKDLHLKKRKKVNKYKMKTKWLDIILAGKDTELAVDCKLTADLSALSFCHRSGKL